MHDGCVMAGRFAMALKQRIAVGLLTLSAAGFTTWLANEGESPVVRGPDGTELLAPHIPTKGDVPTIGHGSTRYEDGFKVKLSDPPITRQQAKDLARELMGQFENCVIQGLPGVKLYQEEADVYFDFTGQFGCVTWWKSSMRRELLAGNYRAACDALLRYRYAAGYDCSTPGNKRCYGVWKRQLERHQKCMEVQ